MAGIKMYHLKKYLTSIKLSVPYNIQYGTAQINTIITNETAAIICIFFVVIVIFFSIVTNLISTLQLLAILLFSDNHHHCTSIRFHRLFPESAILFVDEVSTFSVADFIRDIYHPYISESFRFTAIHASTNLID